MKHIYIILLVLMVTKSAGFCQPAEWSWQFVANPNSQDPQTIGWFGVSPEARDGFDSDDQIVQVGAKAAYFGTHHRSGADGWDGPTGFYNTDLRSALPQQPGASHTWLFFIWADPTLDSEVENLYFDWFCWVPVLTPPPAMEFQLTLMSIPHGITGSPPVGASWSLSDKPQGTVYLPAFRTEDGLSGYVFSFTATMVPEPSSLLALTGGLGLLAGRMRRRKG